MIISLSGASCTGKSTLLDAMKSDKTIFGDKEVKYYGEFIRSIFEEEYSHKYKDFADLLSGDPYDIMKIHVDSVKRINEILLESSDEDILVFDRSPIDASIYLYMNIGDENLGSIGEYVFMTSMNYIDFSIRKFLRKDPIIFFTTPFSDTVEEDGFRPLSLIQRRKYEISLFEKEFKGIPNVYVLPTDLEGRLDMIKLVLAYENF